MATTIPADPQPIVSGVPDVRGISLDRLAGQQSQDAADALRRVLPDDETRRVTVAAFNSSI